MAIKIRLKAISFADDVSVSQSIWDKRNSTSKLLLFNFLQHDQYDIIAAHRQQKRIGAVVSDMDGTIDFREVACQRPQPVKLFGCQIFWRTHGDIGRIRVIGAKARPLNLQTVAARLQMVETHLQRDRRHGLNDAAIVAIAIVVEEMILILRSSF